MLMWPPASPLEYQSSSREQVSCRAWRWPLRDSRMPIGENSEQLAGSPEGMLSPECADQFGQLGINPMWTVMRSSASILEAAPASFFLPREPLIANASTDAVPSAQLRHSEPVAQRVLNELNPFFHRCSLQPGHRQSSLNRELPCSLEGVLPMFPDRSVTDVPGLYLPAV